MALPVTLAEVVAASHRLAGTRARSDKVRELSGLLRRAAAGDPEDVGLVADYLAGVVPQGRLGVGWAAVREPPAATQEASLTLTQVDAALGRLAEARGTGSAAVRRGVLAELLGAATADEQRFLAELITGQVRHGALDGVMLAGIAAAAGVPLGDVQRAAMLAARARDVARLALSGGADALTDVGLQVGRPVRPMLAGSAPDVAEAVRGCADPESGLAVVDCKLDGVRVQLHIHDGEVRIFTRGMEDITARAPEVVAVAGGFACRSAVLDGEVLLVDDAGRPLPFQATGSRVARAAGAAAPLSLFLFDILHRDGRDLLAVPLRHRLAQLEEVTGGACGVPRRITDAAGGREFFDHLVAAGHEGVIVKRLDAPYEAGRRGAAWVKVKPRRILLLVVLAVEWGSGRRRGKLSNIHMGARDPDGGGLVMVGKTFKGMTDDMLDWQTRRFLELEAGRDAHSVHLRPEVVVEVALDSVMRSTRYPGGVALRFARVLRYREDLGPGDADTIDRVRGMLDPR